MIKVTDLNLELYVGDEIFLVGEKEDIILTDMLAECTFGSLELFQNKIAMDAHLSQLTPGVDGEVAVVHGVLTNALTLPDSLNGTTAYIIAGDGSGNYAFLGIDPSRGVEGLEEVIGLLVAGEPDNASEGGYESVPIEDIYILYGYELATVIGVNDDDLDDELLSRCVAIGAITSDLKLDVETDEMKMLDLGYGT